MEEIEAALEFDAIEEPSTRLGGTVAKPGVIDNPTRLMDLLYPGFYMIFLLRNGYTPMDGPVFRERVKRLMTNVERAAQRLEVSTGNVSGARFAFCALLDEIILASKLKIRDEWERRPLQLEIFGEHLAGERFFSKLEELRSEGARRVQVLEVFHMCLLLGFQGRYVMEGSEKLKYLTSQLGDQIVHLQGRRASFAPHWAPPDRVAHKLRSEVPLWAMCSLFAAIALFAFVGLRTQLSRETERELAARSDIVRLAPQPAYITLSLP